MESNFYFENKSIKDLNVNLDKKLKCNEFSKINEKLNVVNSNQLNFQSIL